MIDKMEASSVPINTGLSRLIVRSDGLARWTGVLALVLIAAFAVYVVTRATYERQIGVYTGFVTQLQNENRRLSDTNTKHEVATIDLHRQIDNLKAELQAIKPSEATYNIRPNQSVLVAAGQLAVGLIGAPTNQSVNINVNGEQRLAAAGDVIMTTVSPTTTCKVAIQSFDMFKAVINATCAAEKSQ